jgi:hypothetical protein
MVVNEVLRVRVRPIYGYGWAEGEVAQTIETPVPFDADVMHGADGLEGVIVQGPHAGGRLSMSARYRDWDGVVTVKIDMPGGDSLHGFAEIPIECLK